MKQKQVREVAYLGKKVYFGDKQVYISYERGEEK